MAQSIASVHAATAVRTIPISTYSSTCSDDNGARKLANVATAPELNLDCFVLQRKQHSHAVLLVVHRSKQHSAKTTSSRPDCVAHGAAQQPLREVELVGGGGGCEFERRHCVPVTVYPRKQVLLKRRVRQYTNVCGVSHAVGQCVGAGDSTTTGEKERPAHLGSDGRFRWTFQPAGVRLQDVLPLQWTNLVPLVAPD